MSGAIDKLEIQVPEHNLWTKELRQACERSEPASEALLRMQGGQYRYAVDLRPHGFSSLLFINSRATGSNKLVLDRVGEMSLAEITSQVGTLFHGDIECLKVKRIDLAVDVVDYSVRWFKDHTSVAMKRSGCEFGKLYRDERTRVETLCFGVRPNVIRIYDKLAELKVQTRRTKMRWQQLGAPSHAGNESCQQNRPLTRVERQYGGGRIPQELATLGNLRENALNINPFETLNFSGAADLCDIPPDVRGAAYLKGVALQHLTNTLGYQETIRELNKRTSGKAKRLMRDFEKFVNANQNFTEPDLHALYRNSLQNQLGLPCRGYELELTSGSGNRYSPISDCATKPNLER